MQRKKNQIITGNLAEKIKCRSAQKCRESLKIEFAGLQKGSRFFLMARKSVFRYVRCWMDRGGKMG